MPTFVYPARCPPAQAFAQSLFLGPTTVRVRSTIRCPKSSVDRRLLASTAVEVLRDGDFPKDNAIALHAVYSVRLLLAC